eukprot:Sspe_Gene.39035::Locus_18835_Transcript_1_1_Confidence_1.000_Length_781::g.39035::m.39035
MLSSSAILRGILQLDPHEGPSFGPDEWQSKLDEIAIDRDGMNRLVMNFLEVEGYKEAAECFKEEADVECGCLDAITDRMEIRRAIHEGNIKEAVERVEQLNPDVLKDTKLLFSLKQQQLIELIRSGDIEASLNFARTDLAPKGPEEAAECMDALEQTLCLLAFEDPTMCQYNGLLDVGQRQKTASGLNAAILSSMSQDAEPQLPQLLRLLLWMQDSLSTQCRFPRVTDLSFAEMEKPQA